MLGLISKLNNLLSLESYWISPCTLFQAICLCRDRHVSAEITVENRNYWNKQTEPMPVRSHGIPTYMSILDFGIPGQISTPNVHDSKNEPQINR